MRFDTGVGGQALCDAARHRSPPEVSFTGEDDRISVQGGKPVVAAGRRGLAGRGRCGGERERGDPRQSSIHSEPSRSPGRKAIHG